MLYWNAILLNMKFDLPMVGKPNPILTVYVHISRTWAAAECFSVVLCSPTNLHTGHGDVRFRSFIYHCVAAAILVLHTCIVHMYVPDCAHQHKKL